MTLTEAAIRKPTLSWLAVVLLTLGGLLAFQGLGRLEDPRFTIKSALIITRYPGASALEVEEEVSLAIENALQQLPYVDRISSSSSPGLSQVEVTMRSIYRKDDLAQIWDEMRRKIRDRMGELPPGVMAPIINDDFGDVYGVFLAITGEGYNYEEIANYADFLQRELALVEGVGKISVGGKHNEQVFIEIDRAKLAASGFSVAAIQGVLRGQNLVSDAGRVEVGSEYLRVSPELRGEEGLDALRKVLLGSVDGQLVYLSDVADLYLGYQDPPYHLYRFNGKQALSIGVSFASGVNVVDVGKHLQTRLDELEYARPIGMELSRVYDQPSQVDHSVQNFLIGLAQAVAIVIIVLMLSMGWRPGIIMSAVLLLTIAGTFIIMRAYAIELHRISLGALIIALGMLVDNAIVITEGIMIGLKRGMNRLQAAVSIVSQTRWPLLGATIIAITAFAPIGLSPDASGEFTGSLFWVLFISLLISWILAITLTPFMCALLFREQGESDADQDQSDPYGGRLYRSYRSLLLTALHFRWLTMGLMVALLASAVFAFSQVKQAFFPDSALPMYMLDYWLPEGTSIHATTADIRRLEQEVMAIDGVEKVTASIGRGAERFMLTYSPEKNFASYAQLLVEVRDFDTMDAAIEQTAAIVFESYPQAFTRFKRVSVGPSTAAKIEARISGPDIEVLRRIGNEILTQFRAEPDAINVRQDWREKTKVLRPQIDSAAARRLGINKSDIDYAIKGNNNGQVIGTFRYASSVLPIVVRPPAGERKGLGQLDQVQVYSPLADAYINIGQFMTGVDVAWENPLIKRLDRRRTLSVLADPGPNTNAAALQKKLSGPADALRLPPGYQLQWGGEYEAQQDANTAVFKFLPLGLVLMVVITIFMFNSLKQALVIWTTVPLAIVGVAYGLLIANAPFSFMALLALLSLIGMQIKNGIVLVEEIKRLNDEENMAWAEAIVTAAISRLRPVTMAALTTILGMIPLLSDVFFQPMAVTIMAGLGFATILTLIVVPVLFALFYGVKARG